MKLYSTLLLFVCISNIYSQTIINTINQESFDNFANTYNYEYWDQSWENTTSEKRSFSIQTSSFALNLNYTDLDINSLAIVDNNNTRQQGYDELHEQTFQNTYPGTINYAILVNGTEYATKSSTPTGTNGSDMQNAEIGTWCNKKFISTNFDAGSNSLEPDVDYYYYFTGLELVNWHDRLRMTFQYRPIVDLENAQLKFEVEIPSAYNQQLNSGAIYGFYDTNGKGFAIKSDNENNSIAINDNTITVTTPLQDFIADEQYSAGIIFYPIKNDFSTTYTTVTEKESDYEVSIENTYYSHDYDPVDGVYMIQSANINMGYKNCDNAHNSQDYGITITNNTAQEKTVRLCFWRDGGSDIIGYNSLLIDTERNPTGFPIQTTKNWHGGDTKFFSGIYIRDYTELIVPANTSLKFNYFKTGAKWGTNYMVNSDYLSVNNRDGWLQASMGGFGENITHTTNHDFAASMGSDVRPFLVNASINYPNLSGAECDWTGNVGGTDFWCYVDDSGERLIHTETKTQFKRHSPNLTETSFSALSGDKKMELDATFYLNSADDFMRVFYKIKVKALENLSLQRLDFFQLGGDVYNHASPRKFAYGDENGLISLTDPDCASRDELGYTTAPIPVTGNNPWVWAGDPVMVGGKEQHQYPANRGMIIREYNAVINGQENNIPHFRERCKNSNQSTSYTISLPDGINSLQKDDEISLIVEVVVLPNQDGDYYGPNANFATALTEHGNSWELLYREVTKNNTVATSTTNYVHTSYPITIDTQNNTALVNISGGASYIPLVFSNITDVTDPMLWRAADNCWEIVDQSYHGKDFWQTDYNPSTDSFEIIYSVNQDTEDDSNENIQYYFGPTPPELETVAQSKIDDEAFETQKNIQVTANQKVQLAPQISQAGTLLNNSSNGNWHWTGPNNFTSNSNALIFEEIQLKDSGEYTLSYKTDNDCSTTLSYTIDVTEDKLENFILYPNPSNSSFLINKKSITTTIYDITGREILKFQTAKDSFDMSTLSSGQYIAVFKLENNTIVKRSFIKN